MSNVVGNSEKKKADIYVNNIWIGRIIYYYVSEEDKIIRLHDKNKYVIAQFFKDKVYVELDKMEDNYYGEE